MSQLYLKWDKVYVQGQHKCRGFIVEKNWSGRFQKPTNETEPTEKMEIEIKTAKYT